MATLEELNVRKDELEGRLRDLEEQKASLENEIGLLVEKIPILDMARYAFLLESHTRALREVRDMLQTMAQGKETYTNEHVTATVPSN